MNTIRRIPPTHWSLAFAGLLVFENIGFFYWYSGNLICSSGGDTGAQLLILPIMLSINVLSIPAWISILRTECATRWLFWNGLGATCATLWLILIMFSW